MVAAMDVPDFWLQTSYPWNIVTWSNNGQVVSVLGSTVQECGTSQQGGCDSGFWALKRVQASGAEGGHAKDNFIQFFMPRLRDDSCSWSLELKQPQSPG